MPYRWLRTRLRTKKQVKLVISNYLIFFRKYWFYTKSALNTKDVFSQKQQLLFEAFLSYVNIYQNNIQKNENFWVFWKFDLENDLVGDYHYHIHNQHNQNTVILIDKYSILIDNKIGGLSLSELHPSFRQNEKMSIRCLSSFVEKTT